MATGVESSSPPSTLEESGRMVIVPGGIAMEFPAISDSSADEVASSPFSSPVRLPKRLRRRMMEEGSKTPSSVEEIEAKLREADLRRQQFYENLSSKARGKPRSPSRSSHEEDLGQRLEAKLLAAEQKRLSILSRSQMRLARLDELRQAAKVGVEKRVEKERKNLGTKVESRVKQAEANRMLMLKAYKQRRATLKERTSQSISRRIARESKYKERVHAAIIQKRVAAEKKRLGLLEAEKQKAHARVMQVLQVAKSVSHQREVERRKLRDQLENRLQRARRQRAEYLKQKARQRNSVWVNWYRKNKQADLLSRKLARCWRQFLTSRRTTFALAKDYDALKINEKYVKSMPFEYLACLIESSTTLQTVKILLYRLESRFRLSHAVPPTENTSGLDNIDHLLKRVTTPKKRVTPRSSMKSRGGKKVGASKEATKNMPKLSRYPVRIVLCAYMILGHPDAVFNSQGEREIALAKSAEEFIHKLELLIKIILDGPFQSSDEESDSMFPKRCTFRSQLAAFDKAWCSYLNCFVVWKVKDAESLEEDLVTAACQLELSMIQKCKLTPDGNNDPMSHDMQAIQKQVIGDQKLLREKVLHLSGEAGIQRMERALSDTRSKYFEAKKNGNPATSPIMHILSPSKASSSSAASPALASNSSNKPNPVARCLFREDNNTPQKGCGNSLSSKSEIPSDSSIEKLIGENELIINELLHGHHDSFLERSSVSSNDQDVIKAKIRETMEKAFWDGIMETIEQDEPTYDRVIQLVKEVRDEISGIAPESMKQEIVEAIDLDVLSQVLNSGNLDIGYLGKILELVLGNLQKLCSPAQEDELKSKQQKLMKELIEICQIRGELKHPQAVAMIKGLRFALEQIQALKQEISKARIRMMEPLLKGPAGFDYLRKGFSDRFGTPLDACAHLPLMMQWLLSLSNCRDLEWEEYTNSLLALGGSEIPSQVPSIPLRTGGNIRIKTVGGPTHFATSSNATGSQESVSECTGEKIDLLVRLGLLKLVSAVTGLTPETLPETFSLNLHRLRAVQAQIQNIIVISTSILVFRQTLLMDRAVSSNEDMENILSECAKQLLDTLDHDNNVGIEGIVEVMSRVSHGDSKEANKDGKLQTRKLVMARTLGKSLQAGDPVFEKVSRAVYVAARGIVLGGTGPRGRKLAEVALRQVGAAILTEKLVDAAEVLVVAATVSISVHGPWYLKVTENM